MIKFFVFSSRHRKLHLRLCNVKVLTAPTPDPSAVQSSTASTNSSRALNLLTKFQTSSTGTSITLLTFTSATIVLFK